MDSRAKIGQNRAKSTERSSRIVRQSVGVTDQDTLLDKQLIKLNYLNWFIRVFDEYEQAQNLRIVKKFIAANSRRFRSLLEQMQYLRDNVQKSDKLFLKSYLQNQIHYYADQNQLLDKQQEQLQKHRNRKEQCVEERPTLLQLDNLNTTIGQLNREIEEAQKRQAKIKSSLKNCPFFAEEYKKKIKIQEKQSKILVILKLQDSDILQSYAKNIKALTDAESVSDAICQYLSLNPPNNSIYICIIALAQEIHKADNHTAACISAFFKHFGHEIQEIDLSFFLKNLYTITMKMSQIYPNETYKFVADRLRSLDLSKVRPYQWWIILSLCDELVKYLPEKELTNKIFNTCLESGYLRLRVINKNFHTYMSQSFESTVLIICQDLAGEDAEAHSIVSKIGKLCLEGDVEQIKILSQHGFFQKLSIWCLKKNRYEQFNNLVGQLLRSKKEICWVTALNILEVSAIHSPKLLNQIHMLQSQTQISEEMCEFLVKYWTDRKTVVKAFFDNEDSFEFLLKLVTKICKQLGDEQTMILINNLVMNGIKEQLEKFDGKSKPQILAYYLQKGEITVYDNIDKLIKQFAIKK